MKDRSRLTPATQKFLFYLPFCENTEKTFA